MYATGVEGFWGMIVKIGQIIPSWFGAILSGFGTIVLLWNVSDGIGRQKKKDGRDDDMTYLLLKALSILYFAVMFIDCFVEAGGLMVLEIVLLVLMFIIIAINGFVLNNEKDIMLSRIGKAFIAIVIIGLFLIKFCLRGARDTAVILLSVLVINVIWCYAMYAAQVYLLKKK